MTTTLIVTESMPVVRSSAMPVNANETLRYRP